MILAIAHNRSFTIIVFIEIFNAQNAITKLHRTNSVNAKSLTNIFSKYSKSIRLYFCIVDIILILKTIRLKLFYINTKYCITKLFKLHYFISVKLNCIIFIYYIVNIFKSRILFYSLVLHIIHK